MPMPMPRKKLNSIMSTAQAFLPAAPVPFLTRKLPQTCDKPLMCTAAPPSTDSTIAFVLSHFEAKHLLRLQQQATDLPLTLPGPFSIDLGKRQLPHISICTDGISLSPQPPIIATWKQLDNMSKKGRTGAFECYTHGQLAPTKIAAISEKTNRPASLYPCAPDKPPTIILGGFGMHRFKRTDPGADTEAKLHAVGLCSFSGNVLDICTGLGYTAIGAGRIENVESVTTIELDPMIVEMQRRNPWSSELFTNGKIKRVEGDATVVLKGLRQDVFSVVMHDPPTHALGAELYGVEFYREIARVCRPGGRLFHYIGDPKSRENVRLYKRTAERLKQVGFEDVGTDNNAFGIVACLR